METSAGTEYRIRLGGQLGPAWSAWFDGLRVEAAADGNTLLGGTVPDQAALHGLLAKVRDLGLPLLEVSLLEGPFSASGRGDPSDRDPLREESHA